MMERISKNVQLVILLPILFSLVHSVPIGSVCSGGDVYCGSNQETEKLQCLNALCVGTYLNNNCIKGKYNCAETYYCSPYGLCDRCVDGCRICSNGDTCTFCKEGYYLNAAKTCTSLPDNCASGTSAGCTVCVSGYFLYGEQCKACAPGCISCESYSVCDNCTSGTYWDSTTLTCISGIPNCNELTGSSDCSDCLTGFYLHTDKSGQVSCKQSPLFCETSPDPGECNTCVDHYILLNGACTKLAVTNCNYSTSIDGCSVCDSGYFLQMVCNAPVSNCDTSIPVSLCSDCSDGYYLTKGKCASCYDSGKCKTCSGPMRANCSVCQAGYANMTTSTCSACTVDKCVTCDNYNSAKCDACESGYYVGKDGTCQTCMSGCATCSSATVCTAAAVGYYLYKYNMILQCMDHCDVCNTDGCPTCTDGYYWNSTESKCLECTNDYGDMTCATCSKLSYNCTSCADGQALYSDVTFDGNDYVIYHYCVEDGYNCLQYEEEDVCSVCQTGFYLSGDECRMCGVNCQVCTSSDVCTTCDSGFFLSDGSCTACSANCITCDSATACTKCNTSYTLDVPCVMCGGLHCKVCDSTDYTQCITCVEGYALVSGACKKCPSGCKVCSPSLICQECGTGYYLNSTRACVACVAGCKTCTNKDNCSVCSEGYYLTYSATCNACSGSNVATCNPPPTDDYGVYVSNAMTLTTSCISTSYSNYSCSKVTGCLTPSAPNKCQACLSGYYLGSDYTCSSCQTNCNKCSKSTDCQSCSSGYYLNGASCVACPIGCSACLSGKICTACQRTYTLADSACELCDDTTDPEKCICSTGEYWNGISCITCMDGCSVCSSDTQCDTCLANYYMEAGICQKSTDSYCKAVYPYGTCKTCEPTYFYNSTDNTCAKCSTIANCTLCSSASVCTLCDTGFYASNGACVACSNITNCVSCSSATKCDLCSVGYFWSSTECTKCKTGCKYCANLTTCHQCQIGYSKDYTGICQKCDTGCSTCTETSCASCKVKYYLDSTGVCKACHPLCQSCTGPELSDCSTCINGENVTGTSSACECPTGYIYQSATAACTSPMSAGAYIFTGILTLIAIITALI